jgi:hypothetical protein
VVTGAIDVDRGDAVRRPQAMVRDRGAVRIED